ncbi:MAG: RIP metalloprotease RseP [Planctomycetes bacterium]|nr:RIP metalloprotease RseP [Planctomycetota bacterium]
MSFILISILSEVWPWISIVLGFGLLIFVHELGHFLAAKSVGIRVEAFSIGFGQAIVSFTRGGTLYKIGWIPFGGYVKMKGENPDEPKTGDDDEFSSKKPWQRAIVIVAGVTMNAIFAFICFMIAFSVGILFPTNEVGFVSSKMADSTDEDLLPDAGPAWEAGIRPHDVIVAVGGKEVETFNELSAAVAHTAPGESVEIKVKRGDGFETIIVTPIQSEELRLQQMGIAPLGSNVIGAVQPGSPAAEAGIKAGDRVVEVNGSKTEYEADVRSMLRRVDAGAGETVSIVVERTENGETVKKTFGGIALELVSDWDLGIVSQMSVVVHSVQAGNSLAKAGVKPGWTLVSVKNDALREGIENSRAASEPPSEEDASEEESAGDGAIESGEESIGPAPRESSHEEFEIDPDGWIEVNSAEELTRLLEKGIAGELTLRFSDTEGELREIATELQHPGNFGFDLGDLGFVAEEVQSEAVNAVRQGSPADRAGVQAGDRITMLNIALHGVDQAPFESLKVRESARALGDLRQVSPVGYVFYSLVILVGVWLLLKSRGLKSRGGEKTEDDILSPRGRMILGILIVGTSLYFVATSVRTDFFSDPDAAAGGTELVVFDYERLYGEGDERNVAESVPARNINQVMQGALSRLPHLADEELAKRETNQKTLIYMEWVTPENEKKSARLNPEMKNTIGLLGVQSFVVGEKLLQTSDPVTVVSLGIANSFKMIEEVFKTIRSLFIGSVGVKNLGGPGQIAYFTHDAAMKGLGNWFYILGLLGINLAVINLLPIPVLDGGHLVFIILEKIRGGPVSMKVQMAATYCGLVLLLLLMGFVIFNDVIMLTTRLF